MDVKAVLAAIGILMAGSFCFNLQSQEKNLVLNPGFEKYEKCPEDYTPEESLT